MSKTCPICGKSFPRGTARKFCTPACVKEGTSRRRKRPNYVANQRAKQNRLFRTSEKYRDRHRNYMRGYMLKRRENQRKAAVANNGAQAAPATGE